jgi:hypothetical protein
MSHNQLKTKEKRLQGSCSCVSHGVYIPHVPTAWRLNNENKRRGVSVCVAHEEDSRGMLLQSAFNESDDLSAKLRRSPRSLSTRHR